MLKFLINCARNLSKLKFKYYTSSKFFKISRYLRFILIRNAIRELTYLTELAIYVIFY